MSDVLFEDQISFESYEDFVKHERKPGEVPEGNWDAKRAEDITSEGYEFLYQHGPGISLLVSEEFEDQFTKLTGQELRPRDTETMQQLYPELVFDMADELGDLMWFDFDVAALHNIDIAEACSEALKSHTEVPVEEVDTFEELQDTVIENAHKIKFPGTLQGVMFENGAQPSLAELPAFVLTRMQLILVDALNVVAETEDPNDEQLNNLKLALGNHINALAYVAKERLHIELDDVVRHNVYKLRHRKKFGKQEGNFFNT